jgi:hypothetical protein
LDVVLNCRNLASNISIKNHRYSILTSYLLILTIFEEFYQNFRHFDAKSKASQKKIFSFHFSSKSFFNEENCTFSHKFEIKPSKFPNEISFKCLKKEM